MYLQIIAIALFFTPNTSLEVAEHAFYIAVIEIHHTANSKEADLTIKVFADDMQDALRNMLHRAESIDVQMVCTKYSENVSDYFEAHMSIQLNGNPAHIRFNACEEIGDIYQLNFTVDCPEVWDELEITADFLMELFPTQSQMVHITDEGHTVTARLTSKRKSHIVSFIH